MKLLNFCRGHHLHSAGQPSRWALAHILAANVLPQFAKGCIVGLCGLVCLVAGGIVV